MPPAVTGATAHEGNLGLVFTGAHVLGAWVQQGPVFPGTSRGRSHGRGLGLWRRLTSGEWVSVVEASGNLVLRTPRATGGGR